MPASPSSRRAGTSTSGPETFAAPVRPDVVTFGYWLQSVSTSPHAAAPSPSSRSRTRRGREQLAAQGITRVDDNSAETRQVLLMQPWWLDWTAGLFPVILAVFLLRSFLFEPFKIPSGSMMPTLLVGDLILVNKFHYGVRLPVINKKIVALNDPQPRRRDGVPLSAGSEHRLHISAASSDFRATRSRSAASGSSQRQGGGAHACRRVHTTTTSVVTRRSSTEHLGTSTHHILINPQTTPLFSNLGEPTVPFHETAATGPKA